ncbi:MAG: hypothetical protein IKN62_06530 [Elusimicrobia bacterium]|nr:hypothetical protein [Elusimicrobiota bacterium]
METIVIFGLVLTVTFICSKIIQILFNIFFSKKLGDKISFVSTIIVSIIVTMWLIIGLNK